MAKIEIRNVYKIFGPHPQDVLSLVRDGASKEQVLEQTGHTVGLQDVSLSIDEGQTFVVMGLSGSGKSTLIRHLNRLIDPTAGEILVDGVDILGFTDKQLLEFRRHRSCMVFQRFGLFPHRTVLHNVGYGLNVRGLPREQRNEEARRWITAVGLQGYENVYPDQLSGGMQQRVGLARALATDTDIMLMDEAFSALDPLIRRGMQDQLIDLQRDLHKTIVFITHDLDEALRLGDTIAILNDGKLVQVGRPEDIVLRPADDYVAAFLKDVNRGLVLKAGTVMVEPGLVLKAGETPHAALQRLNEAEQAFAYVVDGEGRLQGVVTAADLGGAAESDAPGLQGCAAEALTVGAKTLLDELLPLTVETDWPLAVVSTDGRLEGVIPRRQAITALVEHRDAEGDTGASADKAVFENRNE